MDETPYNRLVGCTSCGTAHTDGDEKCRLCEKKLDVPDRRSLQRVWAWLAISLFFYIPANVYPLLYNNSFGQIEGHTIIEGIIIFLQQGDLFVAFVIFTASLLVPILKYFTTAYVAICIHLRFDTKQLPRSTLFKLVEAVGRWSMVDVYVVVVLVTLVELGAVVSVQPGLGAVCFLLSVVFAMLAAQSLDTRLLWTSSDENTSYDHNSPTPEVSENSG